MTDVILSILKYIGLVIVVFIVLFLSVIFLVFPFINTCYKGDRVYEYEDLNGNIGTASACQFSDAGNYSKKGGQGQLICFAGNKVIAVKWYEDKTKYGNCYKMLGEENENN